MRSGNFGITKSTVTYFLSDDNVLFLLLQRIKPYYLFSFLCIFLTCIPSHKEVLPYDSWGCNVSFRVEWQFVFFVSRCLIQFHIFTSFSVCSSWSKFNKLLSSVRWKHIIGDFHLFKRESRLEVMHPQIWLADVITCPHPLILTWCFSVSNTRSNIY